MFPHEVHDDQSVPHQMQQHQQQKEIEPLNLVDDEFNSFVEKYFANSDNHSLNFVYHDNVNQKPQYPSPPEMPSTPNMPNMSSAFCVHSNSPPSNGNSDPMLNSPLLANHQSGNFNSMPTGQNQLTMANHQSIASSSAANDQSFTQQLINQNVQTNVGNLLGNSNSNTNFVGNHNGLNNFMLASANTSMANEDGVRKEHSIATEKYAHNQQQVFEQQRFLHANSVQHQHESVNINTSAAPENELNKPQQEMIDSMLMPPPRILPSIKGKEPMQMRGKRKRADINNSRFHQLPPKFPAPQLQQTAPSLGAPLQPGTVAQNIPQLNLLLQLMQAKQQHQPFLGQLLTGIGAASPMVKMHFDEKKEIELIKHAIELVKYLKTSIPNVYANSQLNQQEVVKLSEDLRSLLNEYMQIKRAIKMGAVDLMPHSIKILYCLQSKVDGWLALNGMQNAAGGTKWLEYNLEKRHNIEGHRTEAGPSTDENADEDEDEEDDEESGSESDKDADHHSHREGEEISNKSQQHAQGSKIAPIMSEKKRILVHNDALQQQNLLQQQQRLELQRSKRIYSHYLICFRSKITRTVL